VSEADEGAAPPLGNPNMLVIALATPPCRTWRPVNDAAGPCTSMTSASELGLLLRPPELQVGGDDNPSIAHRERTLTIGSRENDLVQATFCASRKYVMELNY
jgi:hypothetical protein